MNHAVSAIKTSSYQPQPLYDIIDRHMNAHNMHNIIAPHSKVVIKPNLIAKSTPQNAVTTQPEVLEAVILWLKNRGVSDITIADSPGGTYTPAALEDIYNVCKIKDVAQKHGVKLNKNIAFKDIPFAEGKTVKRFNIIEPLACADVIINLPRLKTHGMMMLSGAVKNMFGAIPGLQKPELHFRFKEKDAFASMLVDLCLLLKPAISIVDAVISMEGNGPTGGHPRETGMTFAAVNPFALDLALCDFIGMNPGGVHTVADSIERGLCPADAKDIDYLGTDCPDRISDFIFPDSKPLGFQGSIPKFLIKPAELLTDKLLKPRPYIRRKDCIGCGKCEESCAPKAVMVKNKKAHIADTKCIYCFCCHEMCPVKAIDIKRFRILSR